MPTKPLPRPAARTQLDVSFAIVNIVLLLILFFLATGSLLNAPAGDVDLAETSDLPIDLLPKPILVVEGPEQYLLDGEPLAPADWPRAVSGLPLLHVLIDRDAQADALLAILSDPVFEQTEVRLVTLQVRGEGE